MLELIMNIGDPAQRVMGILIPQKIESTSPRQNETKIERPNHIQNKLVTHNQRKTQTERKQQKTLSGQTRFAQQMAAVPFQYD